MKVPADILAPCSSVVCLRKIYHYSICIWHVSTVLKLANFPKHKNGFLSYHMNHISQKQTRFCYGFFPPFQNALSLSNSLPNPFHSLHLWDTFKETKQRAKKSHTVPSSGKESSSLPNQPRLGGWTAGESSEWSINTAFACCSALEA